MHNQMKFGKIYISHTYADTLLSIESAKTITLVQDTTVSE